METILVLSIVMLSGMTGLAIGSAFSMVLMRRTSAS